MNKKDTYVITIVVRSPKGLKPKIRTICGDTIFINLSSADQSAKWTMKKVSK